jgi:branched-chain amino acid transport system permease protein
MGAILLGFVMAIPMGLVPLMRLGLVGLVMRLLPGKARASDATHTETTAVEGAK